MLNEYVTFYLEDRLYGVGIRFVREVFPVYKITPIPRSENHVHGLVNIRGQVVLILNMFAMLDSEGGSQDKPSLGQQSHVILWKYHDETKRNNSGNHPTSDSFKEKPVGFLVDRMGDVLRIHEGAAKPAPAHIKGKIAQFIDGVVPVGDELALLLNVAKISLTL